MGTVRAVGGDAVGLVGSTRCPAFFLPAIVMTIKASRACAKGEYRHSSVFQPAGVQDA